MLAVWLVICMPWADWGVSVVLVDLLSLLAAGRLHATRIVSPSRSTGD